MSGESTTNATLTTRRRTALVALIVATAIAVGWTFWPQSDPESAAPVLEPAQATIAPTVLKTSECGPVPTKPFVPTRISVDGVTKGAEVLARGRDGNNVPRAADVSTAGKNQFAWDDASQIAASATASVRPPGAKPGSTQGNVLMNAHTWPFDSSPALGNLLLANLHVKDVIVVMGKGGVKLCYRVTKKVVIRAADGSAEYYVQDGPPQLALMVCSPPRLGPGNWENRTIWYASPITT